MFSKTIIPNFVVLRGITVHINFFDASFELPELHTNITYGYVHVMILGYVQSDVRCSLHRILHADPTV